MHVNEGVVTHPLVNTIQFPVQVSINKLVSGAGQINAVTSSVHTYTCIQTYMCVQIMFETLDMDHRLSVFLSLPYIL